LAARAHGSPVVAVSYGYGSDASQLGADAVLDDLARLPAWLAAQGGVPLGKSTTL
jgi:phosphoglycolate phosphatase